MLALALLLIGSATLQWPSFGPFWIDLAWLLPPMTVWLALRFGARAHATVAVLIALSAVPLLGIGGTWVGGVPAQALLALGLIAATRQSARMADIARSVTLPRWVLALALLVIPAGIATPRLEAELVALGFNWWGLPLLAPLLFLAGLTGTKPRDAALGFLLAAALGAVLVATGLDRVTAGGWRIGWSVLHPALWLLAAASWSAGRAMRRLASGGTPEGVWRMPLVAAALLLLLSVDPAQFALRIYLPLGWGRVHGIGYWGTAAALPLAGFVAGAFAGRRGVWIVSALALLPGMAGLGLLWASDGAIGAQAGNLAAAPIVLAWGWLGAHLAGHERDVPRLRIAGAALIAALLVFLLLVDRGGLLQLGLAVVAAIAAALAGAWASRIASRLGVTGKGWIPVAMLPLHAALAIALAPVLRGPVLDSLTPRRLQAVLESAQDGDVMELMMTLVTLSVLALALVEIGRGLGWLPKIARDLRTLVGRVRPRPAP